MAVNHDYGIYGPLFCVKLNGSSLVAGIIFFYHSYWYQVCYENEKQSYHASSTKSVLPCVQIVAKMPFLAPQTHVFMIRKSASKVFF